MYTSDGRFVPVCIKNYFSFCFFQHVIGRKPLLLARVSLALLSKFRWGKITSMRVGCLCFEHFSFLLPPHPPFLFLSFKSSLSYLVNYFPLLQKEIFLFDLLSIVDRSFPFFSASKPDFCQGVLNQSITFHLFWNVKTNCWGPLSRFSCSHSSLYKAGIKCHGKRQRTDTSDLAVCWLHLHCTGF